MRRPARALAVAAGILLLAATLTSGQPRIHVAREVAAATAGRVCGAAGYRIVNAPLGQRTHGRIAISQATWNWDGRRRTACTVTFRQGYRWSWWQLCAALVHETLHLAGYAPRQPFVDRGRVDPFHENDPRSIMWPFIDHAFWRCGPDHNHPDLGPRPP